MKEMILRGLQQAYENMVHMIAEFLPRFVVMFIIMLFGWLVALLLKYSVRAVLHLTKLDRISEESGASQVLRKAALASRYCMNKSPVYSNFCPKCSSPS